MSLPYRRAQVQERCAFLPKLPPGAPEGGSPAGIPPPNLPDMPPLPPFAVSDEVQPVQAMAAAIAMLMAQAKHLCCIVCTLPFVFTAPCCDGFIVVVFPLS